MTNAPKLNTVLMLGALSLDKYFEAVVLGEECTRAKPYPDPYLEGLRLLGLKPEETLVVEDSPAGIRVRALMSDVMLISLLLIDNEVSPIHIRYFPFCPRRAWLQGSL